jgi:catechol 2,3-dioxygenase-like lactoylglutathione lyase family enzyme
MDQVIALRYVGLVTRDFEAESSFFAGPWRLMTVERTAERAHFAAAGSDEPFVIRVKKAAVSGVECMGFATTDRGAVDRIHSRIEAAGIRIASPPQPLTTPGGGYGFRFFDFEGRVLEISAEYERRVPSKPAPGSSTPAVLAHIVLNTPDLARAEAWYREHLGLRVTDWIDGFMTFMRANNVHHCVAFARSPTSLNHIAFEMNDIDEMMRGVGRLNSEGVGLIWGPGRHTVGDSTFSYFRSPSGFTVEYAGPIERLEAQARAPQHYPLTHEVADRWGTGLLGGSPEKWLQPTEDPCLWREFNS